MTVRASLRPARPALSPVQRAMRLQRIFVRMQEGLSYGQIAAEEGVSRERLRQIVRAATARTDGVPDHRRMQIARLMPALRLVAWDVENGDARSIPSFLKLLDRLDRYAAADRPFVSPAIEELVERRRRKPASRDRSPAREADEPLRDAEAPGEAASP